MSQKPKYEPLWPLRLQQLSQELRSERPSQARDRTRAETWAILNFALLRYLNSQMHHYRRLSQEDIEDLASEKSLDLVSNLESGRWEVAGRTGPEIAAYLAATARNGIVDLLRSPDCRRRVEGTAMSEGREIGNENPLPPHAPDSPVERRAFIEALRDCADRLQPRSRRIWFFRVFYDMATKEIAAHPEIGLNPAHVDVVLSNVRSAIRECMENKEQRLRDLPPGSFFEIWKSFHGIKLEELGRDERAMDAPTRI